jgi:molybdopterin molybdotransferase
MTGGAVPDGYDAVVKQEDTDYGETEVNVFHGVSSYMNYCKVGEDIPEGSVVLPKGRRIGRVEAGVLASLGIPYVTVIRPVRVSILSTGSELSQLPREQDVNYAGFKVSQPPVGKIYNSIACTLSAGLPAAGFEVDSGICPDDTDEILRRLEDALIKSDIVITTGGVSVGKRDLLPEVLEKTGAKKVFAGVDIQPGTPTIGSVKDGKVILSLSGNPYAALVNFDLYFWEVAAKLTGCSAFLPERREAELASEYTKVNRHRRILRAKEVNGKVYLPTKSHASSVLSNLLDCNCYIDLPAGKTVSYGDTVEILRMPG